MRYSNMYSLDNHSLKQEERKKERNWIFSETINRIFIIDHRAFNSTAVAPYFYLFLTENGIN